MSRREFSRKTKREALKRADFKCEATGPSFGFKEGQRCNCSLSLGVQFDHVVPSELGGDVSLSNCQSLCVQCHRYKTKSDIKQIRKSDRQRDRNSGVIRPKGSIKGQGFPKTSKPSATSRHSWAPKLQSSLYAPKEETP